VCRAKSITIDGKIVQKTLWELRSVLIKLFKRLTDLFIVPEKRGNARGGEDLAVEPFGQGHIHRTKRRVKGGNKTGLITYPLKGGGGSSEEPDEGKPQVRFCAGDHGNYGTNTPIGGGL
jgi:hypothetical protein